MDLSDFNRIDELARSGYRFASGAGSIPKLNGEFEINCFNAGIANFNSTNKANVSKLFESTRKLRDGANGRIADKELAIVGA